jgi:hypothetical protein
MFHRCILPPSSCCPEKNVIFILTTMRTWNLFWLLMSVCWWGVWVFGVLSACPVCINAMMIRHRASLASGTYSRHLCSFRLGLEFWTEQPHIKQGLQEVSCYPHGRSRGGCCRNKHRDRPCWGQGWVTHRWELKACFTAVHYHGWKSGNYGIRLVKELPALM